MNAITKTKIKILCQNNFTNKNKAKRSHNKEVENNFHIEKCAETMTKDTSYIHKHEKNKITY